MEARHIPDGDVFFRHRNPDATDDLVIPVNIICNTADEVLLDQIKTNAHARGDWLKCSEPHEGVALLVGSGPSMLDTLPTILEFKAQGGTIFALNNAANVLFDHGVMPDFQVICDARAETKQLIGPAVKHLFASQVHPSLFDECPDAQLWHLNICEDFNDLEKQFPEYAEDYALIGGTATVGNVATCLAYAMGYRDLKCFGYDSSHKDDATHAAPQPMNAGEPLMDVIFRGKHYRTSFTMKSQSDTFHRHAVALQEGGAKIEVYGSGLLPDTWRWHQETSLEDREAEKYEMMWTKPSYRSWSPGNDHYESILEKLCPEPGSSFIDFGCGTGRLTSRLAQDYLVTGIDFAANCVDEGLSFPFVKANLWSLPDLSANYGVCCDVMEHIPPEKVDDVLSNIARVVTSGVYFRIEHEPDSMGALIGVPLHLSVHDKLWWAEKLTQHFRLVQAHGDGVFTAWR